MTDTQAKTYQELIDEFGEENVHCCSICGKPMVWDDNIWVNSSFGVCQECYDAIPGDIRLNIEEERYTKKTRKYLDDLGANY